MACAMLELQIDKHKAVKLVAAACQEISPEFPPVFGIKVLRRIMQRCLMGALSIALDDADIT